MRKMIHCGAADRLFAEAGAVLRGLYRTRHEADSVIVDLTRDDGTISWANYTSGPNRLLAVLAAEQRYLVEQEGQGSVSGATYLDKARERVHRAMESNGF